MQGRRSWSRGALARQHVRQARHAVFLRLHPAVLAGATQQHIHAGINDEPADDSPLASDSPRGCAMDTLVDSSDRPSHVARIASCARASQDFADLHADSDWNRRAIAPHRRHRPCAAQTAVQTWRSPRVLCRRSSERRCVGRAAADSRRALKIRAKMLLLAALLCAARAATGACIICILFTCDVLCCIGPSC